MIVIKTSLCIFLFFIISIVFNNSFAIDLKSDNVIFNEVGYKFDKNKNRSVLYADYNLIFENKSKYDDLQIKVTDYQCMYKIGDESISLKSGDKYYESLRDNNGFFNGCSGIDKFITWEAISYKNGEKYKSCYFRMKTYLPYFVWQTVVETGDITFTDLLHPIGGSCNLGITATCDGSICLNTSVNSNTSYNPSNIVITIKDDNTWEPPRIISPSSNSTVENNYITISGKGRNQDGNLPGLKTSFNAYYYEVQSTGDDDNWEGQLWIQCGITGTVSIFGINNTDVTFNGPPCGATITSMQDGQTISAGKYNLSGRVNSDTADDARRMQVQITGYNSDGTIYTPTKSYTPNVDTGTGEWRLDGLEAFCSIQYKASVSGYSSESQATHQSFLPEISGKEEVKYSVQNCPPEITSPKPNSTVENNYITISGKGRNQDGNLPGLKTSFNAYYYEVQSTGDGDNWEGQLWMQCGITGTVSIFGINNTDVTFNGPPCGATITSMQDGQTISAGKYNLSGRVNSDTADDARRMQVQITGYNSDGTIYTPTKSYTPNIDTGTGEWRLDGLEAFCFIQYKASVSGYSSESQATHQSFLPEKSGKEEVKYSVQNCPVKITNPKKDEMVSSTTQDTQNILIEGQASNGSTVDVSYKYNDFESPSYSVSSDSNNWSYEVQGVPVGFITISAVGRNTSDEPIQNNKDEVIIFSSKVFSVKTRNDSVFTEFYGTSMPTIDVNEGSLMSDVEISLDGFEYSENAESDENGNWTYEYKHYAKRGEYIFKFKENSDSHLYKGRDYKKFKCIGSDLGMNCINEN
ncbi:hypothetical protein HGO23_09695 [Xenorhabdus budapestensis]|uniref:Uncharacterized protein n=1 Tax=Xenorhabdus budapestensis TaxID=290110 RepID=A0ABX7VLA2_XENBU|nr:hypothetical protein [Xenorhabdus budapestensis]QTL41541.1 hypothetical protein HGO23_09695 [Xenorhabdus budapestensis]